VNLLLGLAGDRRTISAPPAGDPGYVPENLPPPVPTSLTDYTTMGLRPRSPNLIDQRAAPHPPFQASGLSEILKRLPRQAAPNQDPQPLLLQLLDALSQGGQ
jgi:hypothetical protein